MRYRLINVGPQKSYAIVFDEKDEVLEGLVDFAKEEKTTAASFTAIGAFSDVVLGWFDLHEQDYHRNPIEEQVEVVSLVGNITEFEGKPKIHCHTVVAGRDATAYGGHLLKAHVRPTLEVLVNESPVHLHRLHDPSTGLPLIRPEVEGQPPRRGRSVDAGVQP